MSGRSALIAGGTEKAVDGPRLERWGRRSVTDGGNEQRSDGWAQLVAEAIDCPEAQSCRGVEERVRIECGVALPDPIRRGR